MLKRIEGGAFDVLVVGGGATGLGVAVDSAQRGYKTCLVEAFDFAKGTSSRTTKLVHGGVRYQHIKCAALNALQHFSARKGVCEFRISHESLRFSKMARRISQSLAGLAAGPGSALLSRYYCSRLQTL